MYSYIKVEHYKIWSIRYKNNLHVKGIFPE